MKGMEGLGERSFADLWSRFRAREREPYVKRFAAATAATAVAPAFSIPFEVECLDGEGCQSELS